MEKFDVIVVGGGPGGYLCAERAAQGGLKAAVVEKRWMGGTCLNEGCVPTKSLLYCAKQYAAARHGADYGVHAEQVAIDHAKVVQRKNQVVKTLVNGVKGTMRSHGISVYMAEAKVLGRDANGDFLVQAGDTQLTGKRLVAVEEGAIHLADRWGNETTLPTDGVVIAAGFVPQHDLVEQLEQNTNMEVFHVGDSLRVRQIYDAIHEGFFAARQI